MAADITLYNNQVASTAGSIAAIEGANEINNFPVYYNTSSENLTGNAAAAAAWQQALYTAVHGDISLNGVPVLNLCCFAVSTAADANNNHLYACCALPTLGNITFPPLAQVSGQPQWVTEWGWYTAPTSDGSGVDQLTAARYILWGSLDWWNNGIQHWYVYELIDEGCPTCSGANSGYYNYGLFACAVSGSACTTGAVTAKTSATAIGNLNTIMKDTGATALTFSPGGLGYFVAGMPTANYGSHSLLFQKSNGTFELVLWYEQNLWNTSTSSERTPATASVTVNLGGVHGTVNVYDPITGSSPTATHSSVNSVAVSLGADPVIIEIIE